VDAESPSCGELLNSARGCNASANGLRSCRSRCDRLSFPAFKNRPEAAFDRLSALIALPRRCCPVVVTARRRCDTQPCAKSKTIQSQRPPVLKKRFPAVGQRRRSLPTLSSPRCGVLKWPANRPVPRCVGSIRQTSPRSSQTTYDYTACLREQRQPPLVRTAAAIGIESSRPSRPRFCGPNRWAEALSARRRRPMSASVGPLISNPAASVLRVLSEMRLNAKSVQHGPAGRVCSTFARHW